jgi:PAS domain S-box-containing protein
MPARQRRSDDTGGTGRAHGLDGLRNSSEFHGPVEPVEDHDHGNGHVALVHETDEERLAATVPFVRRGIERGEHCLYVVADAAEREAVMEALGDAGVDAAAAVAAGTLRFVTVEEVYLQGDGFDPDRTLEHYEAVIRDALESYDGIRVVADTGWLDRPSVDRFMEYEARVNDLFDDYDALSICCYDRTERRPTVVAEVVRTHPHLIYDDSVCHNVYYTPPTERYEEGGDGEAERMLRTLRDRAETKAELAETNRFLEELTAVFSEQHRPFEERLQALFELGCERFDLELGGLNRVDPEADRLEIEYLSEPAHRFEPGMELPLSETYCRAPAEAMDTVGVSDPVAEGFDDIAAHEEHGARAYLGTHIAVSGGDDRTLGFVASEPRAEPFSEEARTHIELMSEWVKSELERQQRESELRQSNQQLERVFESSHDPIFVVDPRADEVRRTNPAAQELFGYTEAEMLDRGPSDFHPHEMDRFRRLVDEVYATGSGWTDDLACRHADGHPIPVEISASTVEYGGRTCLLAIVRDVSERRERERELERTERRFETVFNNPVSFVAMLDPDGTVRRVNENGRELIGVEEDAVAGETFWEASWVDRSRSIDAGVRETVANAAAGGYARAEITYRSADGEAAVMDTIFKPVRGNDGDVATILVSGRDITERTRRERTLREAYEIVADADRSLEDQIDALLELGRETLGVDFANLSRVNPSAGRYLFERVATPDDADIGPGDTVDLGETNCERVVAGERTLALRDIETDAPELAGRARNSEWGIACYLGTPVRVGGEVYGSFCFHDTEPRGEAFSEWEVTFVDLLGDWVGSQLERQRDTSRLAALNDLNAVARDVNRALAEQSTHGEIERVVCERLAASDAYEFAWVGDVEEGTDRVVPTTAANADDYLDGVTVTADDRPTGQGPTGRALRTGEPQFVRRVFESGTYEPWHEQAEERGFSASAAVPITFEDRSYGVLNVYTTREHAFDDEEQEVVTQLGSIMGLTMAAVEREERLELLNRLLRHNLLNGLNLVDGRLDLVEGRVDYEVTADLETAQRRTDEMLDLIETLRTVTKGLVDDDHELRAVDLGAVLRDELDRVEQARSEAVFEVDIDTDTVPPVRADDLLREVFDNLLVNAVRHNDKPVPEVTVDVETAEEFVTVHVADNGPGIPEEMEREVFEPGEKCFRSPGTGFGLHLVQQIVDVYDGRITVENRASAGAVFSVSLPRADHSN